jgi:hypothetical protein
VRIDREATLSLQACARTPASPSAPGSVTGFDIYHINRTNLSKREQFAMSYPQFLWKSLWKGGGKSMRGRIAAGLHAKMA